jgi:hypothetical protein
MKNFAKSLRRIVLRLAETVLRSRASPFSRGSATRAVRSPTADAVTVRSGHVTVKLSDGKCALFHAALIRDRIRVAERAMHGAVARDNTPRHASIPTESSWCMP